MEWVGGKFSWEFEGRRRRRKFDFRADGKATCVVQIQIAGKRIQCTGNVWSCRGGRKSAFRPVAVVAHGPRSNSCVLRRNLRLLRRGNPICFIIRHHTASSRKKWWGKDGGGRKCNLRSRRGVKGNKNRLCSKTCGIDTISNLNYLKQKGIWIQPQSEFMKL